MKNLVIPAIIFLFSCKSASTISSVKDDNKIDLTIVQVNDVYEIAPIAGGREGGIARVAEIKKEEIKKNPRARSAKLRVAEKINELDL